MSEEPTVDQIDGSAVSRPALKLRPNADQNDGEAGTRWMQAMLAAADDGSGTVGVVARSAADLPSDPAVVVLNPEDEVTPESFAAWLDRRQAGEPADPGVSAAETLAEARAAGQV